MASIFDNIPVAVIVVIIVSVIKALTNAAKGKNQSPASASRTGEDESEEQRRVREIQERIRRIAAERRGERPVMQAPPPLVPVSQPEPTVFRPASVPPVDT